ncbi:MAG TPA: chaperone modulator CbpM [Candidatus Dormibacteraeota bacterium]|nr:chaperone modulator CbpM [Candidatus Dormibacteraeota bacterium]
MTSRYIRLSEVCERFAIDEELLRVVEAEKLVEIKHPADAEPVLSPDQAERLRLVAVLMRELEVNVAGVEVILHMHEDLCSMQRQFNEVLQAVVTEMRRRLAG